MDKPEGICSSFLKMRFGILLSDAKAHETAEQPANESVSLRHAESSTRRSLRLELARKHSLKPTLRLKWRRPQTSATAAAAWETDLPLPHGGARPRRGAAP